MNPDLPPLGGDIPEEAREEEDDMTERRLIDFSPLRLPMTRQVTNPIRREPLDIPNLYADLYSEWYVKENRDKILEEAKRKVKEEFLSKPATGQDDNHSQQPDSNITESQTNEIIRMIEEDEQREDAGTFTREGESSQFSFSDFEENENAYDNDFLIHFIQDVKRKMFEVDRFVEEGEYKEATDTFKQELYNDYIQILLDLMFHSLLIKYSITLPNSSFYLNINTAKPEVLQFFKTQQSSVDFIDTIRKFKRKFREQLINTYDDINNRIEIPEVNEEVLQGRGVSNPITETRSKFLKYYTDSEDVRKVKIRNFTDELINAVVFQYIFGCPVLGSNFEGNLDKLDGEESESEYPFLFKNKFLFGWAGDPMKAGPAGVFLENITKVPSILLKLEKYSEKVAKNAVLCIIRCQFSEWTMRTQDENIKYRKDETNRLADEYKTLYGYYKGMKKSEDEIQRMMELDITDAERDDIDFKQEQIDAFMEVVKGKEVPKDYQYFDSVSRKKVNEFKPFPITTLGVLRKNLGKKYRKILKSDEARRELFEVGGKNPRKKTKQIDLLKE